MPVERTDSTTYWIRRIARVLSVPIIVVALLTLIGHIVVPEPTVADYAPIENLLPVIMFLSVLGLGIAWRWEGLGGALSVGFFLLQLALFWAIRGRFFPLQALLLLLPVPLTGVLFLACWLLSKVPTVLSDASVPPPEAVDE